MVTEQDLVFIERDLRRSLNRYTQKARVRGDFMEAIFAVHSGLERVFDLVFDEGKWRAEGHPEPWERPSFVHKAEQVIPDLEHSYDYFKMNQDRNDCAHPKGRYYTDLADDEKVQEIAAEFVNLACDVWPRLLPGSPPDVRHPRLAAAEDVMNAAQVRELRDEAAKQKRTLAETARLADFAVEAGKRKDQRIEALEAEVASLRQERRDGSAIRRLSWGQLLIGVLLLLPVPFLLGFALEALAVMREAWAWPAVAGVALLVFFVLGLRRLVRFLRDVHFLPLLAVFSVVLVVATLLLVPTTDDSLQFAVRAGTSLTTALDTVADTAGDGATVLFDAGVDVADWIALREDG